jgi:hypothetical protein
MNALRWLANFLVGAFILVASLYLVISIGIAYYKLTGRITDGRLYEDLRTPGWAGLVLFQAVCTAIIAAGFWLRRTLRAKPEDCAK